MLFFNNFFLLESRDRWTGITQGMFKQHNGHSVNREGIVKKGKKGVLIGIDQVS